MLDCMCMKTGLILIFTTLFYAGVFYCMSLGNLINLLFYPLYFVAYLSAITVVSLLAS